MEKKPIKCISCRDTGYVNTSTNCTECNKGAEVNIQTCFTPTQTASTGFREIVDRARELVPNGVCKNHAALQKELYLNRKESGVDKSQTDHLRMLRKHIKRKIKITGQSRVIKGLEIMSDMKSEEKVSIDNRILEMEKDLKALKSRKEDIQRERTQITKVGTRVCSERKSYTALVATCYATLKEAQNYHCKIHNSDVILVKKFVTPCEKAEQYVVLLVDGEPIMKRFTDVLLTPKT